MVELEHIPILSVSQSEMEDPIGFLSKPSVRLLGHKYGMIKLVPHEDFKPPLSIDQENFKFRVRLQYLNELNILNRGRLFMMKQLNNYYLRGKRRPDFQLAKPFLELPGGKVYFYDLFIAVVRFFNQDIKKESQSSGLSYSGRKRPRSRRLGDEEQSRDTSELIMAPLSSISDNMALWKQISSVLNASADELRSTFLQVLAPYYDFMQRKMEAHGGHASLLSNVIYSEEFPKSLLNDSEDNDSAEDDDDEEGCTMCSRTSHQSRTILCDSCDKPFHIFCLDPPLNEVPRGKWVCNNCIFGNGYYGFKEENKFYSRKEFQAKCQEFDTELWPNGDKLEDLEELERMFWGKVYQIERSSPIRYGADIHNAGPGEMTGFPTAEFVPDQIQNDPGEMEKYKEYITHPMNLVNLPSAKGSLLSIFGRKISGMTVPWMYIGSTFSTFCWHLEDQYTLSANYQHEGDPKVWYSIPESSCEKFNELMRNIAPDLFQKQPDLLHQLVTLIAPYDEKFQKANISCFKAVQYPGEYIVTFPKCYHSGFNTGYNFNEAVNFTLDLWLPYGVEATRDYIHTGKRCVFDMWELMLTVLVEYIENPKKFDEALVRKCHAELLRMFNQEIKTLDQLGSVLATQNLATGFTRRHIDLNTHVDVRVTVSQNTGYDDEYIHDVENDSDHDGDDDIFCSACKTICTFAFVVHRKNSCTTKRRRHMEAMSPGQWNRLAEKGDMQILCAKDYFNMVEKADVDQANDADDSDADPIQQFKHDEVFYIRQPDEIRCILQTAQRKIDSMLR
ncbi:LADA_0A00826g1_1 [Lachancea dasiensis]|uniref:LADA_0A00826g1_1 n=1 Tax=Lachancea dasiensis TaxID=1072105 RepID=A0A1G4IM65_9SACH|nr:LADA_0A00826g1_1 [Lachancea dasiensis]